MKTDKRVSMTQLRLFYVSCLVYVLFYSSYLVTGNPGIYTTGFSMIMPIIIGVIEIFVLSEERIV